MPSSRIDSIRLLTRQEVADHLGISPWTLTSWVNKGKFPQPLRLSTGHALKWRVIEIEQWLARKARTSQKRPLQGVVAKHRVRLPRAEA